MAMNKLNVNLKYLNSQMRDCAHIIPPKNFKILETKWNLGNINWYLISVIKISEIEGFSVFMKDFRTPFLPELN